MDNIFQIQFHKEEKKITIFLDINYCGNGFKYVIPSMCMCKYLPLFPLCVFILKYSVEKKIFGIRIWWSKCMQLDTHYFLSNIALSHLWDKEVVWSWTGKNGWDPIITDPKPSIDIWGPYKCYNLSDPGVIPIATWSCVVELVLALKLWYSYLILLCSLFSMPYSFAYDFKSY